MNRTRIKLTMITIFLVAQTALSAKTDEAYDEFTFVETEGDSLSIHKVQCYTGRKLLCNLNTTSINKSKKDTTKCTMLSSVKLINATAQRMKDESWQVNHTIPACNELERFTFSKSGMVVVRTAPAKFNKEQAEVCKSYSPKTRTASTFEDSSGFKVDLGGCKEMIVHMFAGDIIE